MPENLFSELGRHLVIGRKSDGRSVEALGGPAVFRLDEGLKVYLHRALVDFRLSMVELFVMLAVLH